MNPYLRNFLAFLVGVIILSYIVWNLGIDKIAESLSKTRIDYFLIAAIFYLINEFFASLALKIPINAGIKDVMLAHMCGMLYSNATPGRIGYYYTAFPIAKRTNKSISGNMGVITVIQGVNFLIKMILCIIAIIYFSKLQHYFLFVSVIPIIILMIIFLVLYTDIVNRIIKRLSLINKFLKNVELMQKASREIDNKTLMEIIIISFISWIFMSAQWYFIAYSLGAQMTFITVLLLQPLLTTVMFIPISPAGLGITEGGGAILFNILSLNQATGVTFILLIRFNSIIVDSLGMIFSHNPSS